MTEIARPGKKLTLTEKFSRLSIRLRDPEWRRYGRLLLAGKVVGVGLVLLVILSSPGVF